MPEGRLHGMLVAALAHRLSEAWAGEGSMLVDARDRLEWSGIPPAIGRHRPDIFARAPDHRVFIGEAKSAHDIENTHTDQQMEAYFDHLATCGPGEFHLAVPHHTAGLGFRVCLAARRRARAASVPFEVTGWMFGSTVICEAWRG